MHTAINQGPLAAGVAQLKTLLARVLAGGVPLPRASKVISLLVAGDPL